MTPESKTQFLYTWDRFQKRHERIYTTKFKAALKEQVNEHLTKGHITSEPIYKVLIDLYQTVGGLWAHKTQLSIRRKELKSRQPMGFNERIVALMRQYYGIDLLNDAEEITTYTREVIAKVFSEAAITGASINDIVRQLEANTGLGAMRARRIARTEVTASANRASLLNAISLNIPMRKIWLSVNDRKTRHSHREIDEHKARLDQPFNVNNGILMLVPGDRVQTNGLPVPASETVECRCCLGYEVIE